MSDSADILMFDWDIIVDTIVNNGCDDRHMVEDVLKLFGEKIGDKYVILSSSHHDFGEDSLSPMCHAIDKIFGTDDMYSDVLDAESKYIGGWASDKCSGCNDRIINIMMCKRCNDRAGASE